MNRRIPTDAKIVLERAGYTVKRVTTGLWVGGYRFKHGNGLLLPVDGGTVDNNQVNALLAVAGFNEFGHKVSC